MSDIPDDTEQPSTPTTASNARWAIPLVTGLAGLVVGAAIVGGVWVASNSAAAAASQAATAKAKAAATKLESERKSILKDALAECGLTDSTDSQLGDSGYTLTIDGHGDDDFGGLEIADEACLLNTVNAPSAVISHVDQTTSLDGRQTETWGNVTFAWTYHPDRGLDGVFTVAK